MRKRRLYPLAIILGLIFVLNPSIFGGAAGEQPLRILITNDDGIKAPGIQALATAFRQSGKVTVAAPSQNWSGTGHGTTFTEPIMLETWESEGTKWHSISAMPATCVRLALTSLLDDKPDFVVSGINRGENFGVITFSSATVACVREAAYHGIPAVAASLQKGKAMDYDSVADFIVRLVQEIKKKQLPPGIYLNVNYPALPRDQIRGVLVTQQDLRVPNERYEKRVNPEGKIYFWSVFMPLEGGKEKTDVWALTNGFISITPMHFDQTHYPLTKSLKSMVLSGLKRQTAD